MLIFDSASSWVDPASHQETVLDLIEQLSELRALIIVLHDAYYSKKRHPNEKVARNRVIFMKACGLTEEARRSDGRIATKHRRTSGLIAAFRRERLLAIFRTVARGPGDYALVQEVLYYCDCYHVLTAYEYPESRGWFSQQRKKHGSPEIMHARLTKLLKLLRARVAAINLGT